MCLVRCYVRYATKKKKMTDMRYSVAMQLGKLGIQLVWRTCLCLGFNKELMPRLLFMRFAPVKTK
jgi:hypothetical protein